MYEIGDLVLYVDKDGKNCYGVVIDTETALFVREPKFVSSQLEFFRGNINTLSPMREIIEDQIQMKFGFPIKKALSGMIFAAGFHRLISPDKAA